jgi:copper chaperone
MSKVVLDIPEISCDHCSQAITKALQPQAGVKTLRVDIPTHKVHLEFDDSRISLDKVKQILEEEEYRVEAVETV